MSRVLPESKYRYLLVDEFQDTDPLQVEIVFLLCRRRPGRTDGWATASLVPGKLFLVGDPKQSIYRFRDADIAIFQRVKEPGGQAGRGARPSRRTSARCPGVVELGQRSLPRDHRRRRRGACAPPTARSTPGARTRTGPAQGHRAASRRAARRGQGRRAARPPRPRCWPRCSAARRHSDGSSARTRLAPAGAARRRHHPAAHVHRHRPLRARPSRRRGPVSRGGRQELLPAAGDRRRSGRTARDRRARGRAGRVRGAPRHVVRLLGRAPLRVPRGRRAVRSLCSRACRLRGGGRSPRGAARPPRRQVDPLHLGCRREAHQGHRRARAAGGRRRRGSGERQPRQARRARRRVLRRGGGDVPCLRAQAG